MGVEPMVHPGYHLVFDMNAPTLGGCAASVGAYHIFILGGSRDAPPAEVQTLIYMHNSSENYYLI